MSGSVFDPQMMNLSSSDLSDSDEVPSPRSSLDPIYLPKVEKILNELLIGFRSDHHRGNSQGYKRDSGCP